MKTTAQYVRQNAESKKATQDQIDKIMRTHRVNGFLIAAGVVLIGVVLMVVI